MNDPLYRLKFDAQTLLREHPPRMRHPYKAELLALAYPDGIASPAEVEVTRWGGLKPLAIDLSKPIDIDIKPSFFDYLPSRESQPAIEWHVNFADPQLFVAYGSNLMAQ